MKSSTKNIFFIIFLVILLTVIVMISPTQQTAFTGATPQTFNSGGRLVYDIIQTPEKPGNIFDNNKIESLQFNNKITVYTGTGWDNVCYTGFVAYLVRKDTPLDNKLIASGNIGYTTYNQDANRQNRPATYASNFIQDIKSFEEGTYLIEFINFMTPFTDRPSTGDCDTFARWSTASTTANAKYTSFKNNPEQWLQLFAQQQGVRTDYITTYKFTIKQEIACVPDWQCTAYSSCSDGEQTRICMDANQCGITDNKPAEIQSCEVAKPNYKPIIAGIAIIVLIISLIILYSRKKR